MVDIKPILLSNPNIQHVAATQKTTEIGRWDIITDVEHHESVKKDIAKNIAAWLLSASEDPEHPENYPHPGIATRDTFTRDTSSLGDTSYLWLLYTSDAAEEEHSVDLGGRRCIKYKTAAAYK